MKTPGMSLSGFATFLTTASAEVAVLIGPYDLSSSFGKLGQLDDPEVQAAMIHTREVCLAYGVPCGLFVASPEMAAQKKHDRWSYLLVSTDLQHLSRAVRESMRLLDRDPTQPTP